MARLILGLLFQISFLAVHAQEAVPSDELESSLPAPRHLLRIGGQYLHIGPYEGGSPNSPRLRVPDAHSFSFVWPSYLGFRGRLLFDIASPGLTFRKSGEGKEFSTSLTPFAGYAYPVCKGLVRLVAGLALRSQITVRQFSSLSAWRPSYSFLLNPRVAVFARVSRRLWLDVGLEAPTGHVLLGVYSEWERQSTGLEGLQQYYHTRLPITQLGISYQFN